MRKQTRGHGVDLGQGRLWEALHAGFLGVLLVRAGALALCHQERQPLGELERDLLTFHTRDVCLDHLGDAHRVLIADFEDRQRERGLAAETRAFVDIDESLGDVGDIAEPHNRAVGLGADDDAPDLVGPFLSAQDADSGVGGRRFDRAAGEFLHLGADALGDHGQAEFVSDERFRADLDEHLVAAHAGDTDVAHARDEFEIVADGLDRLLHRALVGVAVERDADRGQVGLDFFDADAVGLGGQVLQRIHLAFDLGDLLVDVGALGELDRHRGQALGDRGVDLLDIVEIVHDVLDALGQRVLDLVGTRAGVGRHHRDQIRTDLWEELAFERESEDHAGGENREHHEVRNDRTPDAKAGQTHEPPPDCSTCPAGSTIIPPTSSSRLEMITSLPGSRPDSMTAHSRSAGSMSGIEPRM